MPQNPEHILRKGVENDERWPASASIAVLLTYNLYYLIMVRQRKIPERGHQVWGIPAGGLIEGEALKAGLLRELWEETKIHPKLIDFTVLKPHVVCVPSDTKTSVGLVFDAFYKDKEEVGGLDIQGWNIEDKKVDMAKPQSVISVTRLIESDLVYLPEINVPQMMRWLMRINDSRSTSYNTDVHKYLDWWLRRKVIIDKIDGLRISSLFGPDGEPFYKPPYQDW